MSGGVDSTTCLAIARSQGYACYALTFDYGQRHRIEIDYARRLAADFSVVEHRVFNLDLTGWQGSALTNPAIAIPHERSNDVPITYVPARNTIFLSLALAWAETLGAYDIFFGANADDEKNYPDCRADFITAFETLANIATRDGVEGRAFTVHAPLLHLRKVDIIKKGLALGVNYDHTFSCYDPTSTGHACGHCDACVLRNAGFRDATFNS